eukprot:CAMPEP_0182472074 /NCGR_PEP_ID=MMETSP1319-20130603/21493_1 /TAXON_ID=172717 /ORGANISM="Bolidomonas pacifica, Strain RCC208" /LENGTH=481 /DNA_ID=CAMNT_0024672703 /DNA_START=159 /DNA_END=1601 /DNA_ORIENTATION=-
MFNTSRPSSSSGGGSSSSSSLMTSNFHYPTPPTYELSLHDFESFSLSRLVVLRKIEESKVKGLDRQDFNSALRKACEKHLPMGGSDAEVRELNVKRDTASHFILRLAYCRTEDLRRWLLTHETLLFKFRLEELEKRGGSDLKAFLKGAAMEFDRLSGADKEDMKDKLRFGMSPRDFEAQHFYKVPFAQATDLLARRQVYVGSGFAYVPSSKLVTIVTARFRMNLSKSLSLAAASFAVVSQDTRVGPLLKNMNRQYTGRSFGDDAAGAAGDLTAATVDDYAKRSMPLCMRAAHDGLKKDHKLKHDARRQYGLFLKGAGMSMEESLLFFQNEFTKVMSADDFNKNYSYNIRHMYGKEGKRQSYSAFSSTTIIMGPRPNPSEVGSHHGCPFAHTSDSSLSALLSKMGIGGSDKADIMNHKKSKNFQLACAKHFEAQHPNVAKMTGPEGVEMDGVGNHPNAWFAASVKYWEKVGGGKKKGAEGKP